MNATRTTSMIGIALLVVGIASENPRARAAIKPSSAAAGQQDSTTSNQLLEIAEEGPLVKKSYDVRPLLELGVEPDELSSLITNILLVTSWSDVGGPGTLSIDPSTGQCRVHNVASVQNGVEHFLRVFTKQTKERLRRKADAPLPPCRSMDLCCTRPGTPFFQRTRLFVVSPLLYANATDRNPRDADDDSLIALTTSSIAPESWDILGGPGTISAWPLGDALVINQSSNTLKSIESLFTTLSQSASANRPVKLPSGMVATGRMIGEVRGLESWVFPVHDLLPLETRPVYRLSPRAMGLGQLGSWLGDNTVRPKDAPWDLKEFATTGSLIATTDTDTARKIGETLTKLRARRKTAATPSQRNALDNEVFPGLFRDAIGTQQIYLYGSCNADQQLAEFAKASDKVVQVRLIATDVTDEGLKSLAKFAALRDLTIWSNQFTANGLTPLVKLKMLQNVTIRGKQISDEVAYVLQRFPMLQSIDVSNTSITDQGMLELAKGRQWLMLNVSHTRATAAGVESMRKTRPNVLLQY